MQSLSTRSAIFLLLAGIGCSSTDKRQAPEPQPPVVGRGSPAVPNPLTVPSKPIPPTSVQDDFDDRALLIPPPPSLEEMKQSVKPNTEITAASIKLVKADNTDLMNVPAEKMPAKQTGSLTTTGDNVKSFDRVEKDDSLVAMNNLYRKAYEAYSKIDCFDARLTRRETINAKANPQEIIHFMFRKEPFSVRLKWIGAESQGREVIYVSGQYGGKMHIMPTKQDSFPLPPMRMAFLPDDSMVRTKTRHDIRDAGLAEAIRGFGIALESIAKNPAQRNRLRYLGQVMRPEYASKMETVEETIAPGTEPLLPRGGKRVYFFDTGADSPSAGLPVLIVTHDAGGKEVEYYCFDRLTTHIRLTDRDFNPDEVWTKK